MPGYTTTPAGTGNLLEAASKMSAIATKIRNGKASREDADTLENYSSVIINVVKRMR